MSVISMIEVSGGKPTRLSLECLSAAAAYADVLGTSVQAVVTETGVAAELARYPVQGVIVLQSPMIAQYTPDGYTAALQSLITSESPDAIFFPHSYQVRDYAPKVATRFSRVLISDVVAIRGKTFVRQLFGGKLNADVNAGDPPVFVSVQAGAFRAPEPSGASAPIRELPLDLSTVQIRSEPEAPFQESQRSVDLTAAERIVSVGRGIRDQENLGVVEALAKALGAELAASRPICDNGWLPMERQVGSSGQTVAPKLYVAVGVSGAIQHLVGMKGSKTIVAINKDETAPIFEIADYGIVGDLFEVVPALVDAIEKGKG